jgi:hypothetical protein
MIGPRVIAAKAGIDNHSLREIRKGALAPNEK